MGNSFLDKNVLLAYCFTIESHHPYCKEYIEDSETDPYVTEEVREIFPRKREELTERYSGAVLDHAAQIKRSGYDGQLGPMDLQEIRNSIDSGNSAKAFLERWYQEEVPQLIDSRRLTNRLHDLARDLDEIAVTRKRSFDEKVELWERERDYPGVREDLREIEERKVEDMWICIDAHDLAVRTDGTTALATTDLDDFLRDGREKLIKSTTAIDEIVSLASTEP